jgi:hypothetical protein
MVTSYHKLLKYVNTSWITLCVVSSKWRHMLATLSLRIEVFDVIKVEAEHTAASRWKRKSTRAPHILPCHTAFSGGSEMRSLFILLVFERTLLMVLGKLGLWHHFSACACVRSHNSSDTYYCVLIWRMAIHLGNIRNFWWCLFVEYRITMWRLCEKFLWLSISWFIINKEFELGYDARIFKNMPPMSKELLIQCKIKTHHQRKICGHLGLSFMTVIINKWRQIYTIPYAKRLVTCLSISIY